MRSSRFQKPSVEFNGSPRGFQSVSLHSREFQGSFLRFQGVSRDFRELQISLSKGYGNLRGILRSFKALQDFPGDSGELK